MKRDGTLGILRVCKNLVASRDLPNMEEFRCFQYGPALFSWANPIAINGASHERPYIKTRTSNCRIELSLPDSSGESISEAYQTTSAKSAMPTSNFSSFTIALAISGPYILFKHSLHMPLQRTQLLHLSSLAFRKSVKAKAT